MPRLDLTGRVFGLLTVVRKAAPMCGGRSAWECRCACGQSKCVLTQSLQAGRSRSCGCIQRTHGDSSRSGAGEAPEYSVWLGLRARCSNPKNKLFRYYGGRGISVCDRWSGPHSYEIFLADVGRRPSSKHSLDRIDNNLGYEPSNVRWATRTQQMRNTRRSRIVAIDGVTRTLVEWAEVSGVSYGTIHRRLTTLGWSPKQAVFAEAR